MLKILFRVDGSQRIGMGHIIRCLSLAKELKNAGVEVAFITKHKEGESKVISSGFKAFRIPCDIEDSSEGFYYGSPEDLIEESGYIINLISNVKPQILIIDSYNVSMDFFSALKQEVKTVYIDDINRFNYPVDMIINGNINATDLNYTKHTVAEQMLLGIDYNMIRNEFKDLPKRIVAKEITQIMITTGGSDLFGLSQKLSKWILTNSKFENIQINLIVGSAFSNKSELNKLALEHKNFVLYENPKKISEIMLQSDIAISSGGSTLYELCACGTPTISFIVADNQLGIVLRMNELGLVQSIGWHNELEEESLIKNLSNLMENFEKRKEISSNGQKLVDGNGCSRIVEKLLQMI
ncbi:MAG: UDP-2,4-diacetamido-2,4,6-trideoxy-beta-L-altropyranose hydrolase [Firmicutes bacterium HGW-Firmicutes-1]|jgi:UDP-2,4-diacetamido-2,4,6-trideoxy-beta-L-altropyranose hydrolase|nr:MAG: UDP-2,4-diacetamido-2,4,6-trideoxy-beta-L-altropyranose hydrolase [Firmicutes bacterium HGW-Firmicutes-1]